MLSLIIFRYTEFYDYQIRLLDEMIILTWYELKFLVITISKIPRCKARIKWNKYVNGVSRIRVYYHQQLGDVASAKDFVNGSEFVRLMRREIWREGAFLSAAASQELAGGTRGDSV